MCTKDSAKSTPQLFEGRLGVSPSMLVPARSKPTRLAAKTFFAAWVKMAGYRDGRDAWTALHRMCRAAPAFDWARSRGEVAASGLPGPLSRERGPRVCTVWIGEVLEALPLRPSRNVFGAASVKLKEIPRSCRPPLPLLPTLGIHLL